MCLHVGVNAFYDPVSVFVHTVCNCKCMFVFVLRVFRVGWLVRRQQAVSRSVHVNTQTWMSLCVSDKPIIGLFSVVCPAVYTFCPVFLSQRLSHQKLYTLIKPHECPKIYFSLLVYIYSSQYLTEYCITLITLEVMNTKKRIEHKLMLKDRHTELSESKAVEKDKTLHRWWPLSGEQQRVQ